MGAKNKGYIVLIRVPINTIVALHNPSPNKKPPDQTKRENAKIHKIPQNNECQN